MICIIVDSPNLCFPYLNFLGGTSEKITLYDIYGTVWLCIAALCNVNILDSHSGTVCLKYNMVFGPLSLSPERRFNNQHYILVLQEITDIKINDFS